MAFMKMPIKIRAHHLLCIPRFYRGGYDARFAENMKKICQKIRKNPDVNMKILVDKPDDLCKECLHWQVNKCIQSKEIGRWIVPQDKKIVKYLKLKPNSIHIAKDVFNLSIDKINSKNIRKICKGCIFLDNCIKVGINSAFKKDLNK